MNKSSFMDASGLDSLLVVVLTETLHYWSVTSSVIIQKLLKIKLLKEDIRKCT